MALRSFRPDADRALLTRARNAPIAMEVAAADLVLCPTRYQASQFPPHLRDLLTVMHDGVDCAACAPPAEPVPRAAGLDVGAMDEVVTYFTRVMEPFRGFPTFMRALPRVMAERPGAHVIIGGEDRVAYGTKPRPGEPTWKDRMLVELEGKLDRSRLHFCGLQPRAEFLKVLQASDAHVYLTTDFVLSWSLLDAMACAAPLIVNDCPPVREFLGSDACLHAGLHEPEAVAAQIIAALADKAAMAPRRAAARRAVLERCDKDRL